MDYVIAIPTYKRSNTIAEKTLPYLVNYCKLNPNIINVFVADEEEAKTYYDVCRRFGVTMLIGKHTLRGQRNYINEFYQTDELVVQIDDDIEGIYSKIDDKNYEKVEDLDAIIKMGFQACTENKTKLWGIGAVLNPLFLKHSITSDLRYIGGGFWGEVIDHSPDLKVVLEDKEDFERSIRYFKKFGAVVRLNGYSWKTIGYKGAGGMQETRTEQRITESAEWLLREFPTYCARNEKKTLKHTEVRLIRNPTIINNNAFNPFD